MEQNEAVFSVLKTALWGEEHYPFSAEGETDWQAVYRELSDHAVASLTVDVLPLIPGMEPELRQKWLMGSTRKMMFWHKLMNVQQELCNLLRKENIPFAILKGAAAAVYYPKPEYRTMGDIDVLIHPDVFDRALSRIQEQGWEVVHDNERHIELNKNGMELELHRYFATIAVEAVSEAFDGLLFDALGRMDEMTLGRYRLPVLPRLENGLVLLAHIGQHLRYGLGLRQIIDWMLYVDRELDDDLWSESFQKWSRLLGLEQLVIHVTRMCQLYLGLREDRITWCAGADDELCRELMELTLSRGNFGSKMGDYSRVSSALVQLADWKNLPRNLQRWGECNWKALKKHPWLRPFAWLYQICRYIRRGLARKNPFRKLGENVQQVSRESRLWEKIGVKVPRRRGGDPSEKSRR